MIYERKSFMEGTDLMARKKEPSPAENIAKAIIENYDPKSIKDVEDAVKSIFAPIFESMLQGEMDYHLGYETNDHSPKATTNRRNGYGKKTLKSSIGEIPIQTPRDRDGSFEPELVPKRTTDVSGIEQKVISMYAKGLSQRDITDIIEDIYGFRLSAEKISMITDSVLDELTKWQSRMLKKFYAFLFVDCIYVNIRTDYESKNRPVYVILAYDLSGRKDILGLWLGKNEGESASEWLLIFDELKNRGVEDIAFISMDGLKGLEEGAKAIFPKAVIQRCIVHLIRNSLRYVPQKHYKAFTAHLKLIYKAPNRKVAALEFEKFKEAWREYPSAIKVWETNWTHVEQLYDYTAPIRRIMYTTNAIESINSSFRKVTRKGTFPTEEAVLKILYLRVLELYDKWSDKCYPNWPNVLNNLMMIESISPRIEKYIHFE